jgi:hypothetical protein
MRASNLALRHFHDDAFVGGTARQGTHHFAIGVIKTRAAPQPAGPESGTCPAHYGVVFNQTAIFPSPRLPQMQ